MDEAAVFFWEFNESYDDKTKGADYFPVILDAQGKVMEFLFCPDAGAVFDRQNAGKTAPFP